MKVRQWWLAVGLLLGVASVARAQGGAGVAARVTVGEVLQLSTVSSGGEVVTDGVYREVTGVVLLRVRANRSWKLVVTSESPQMAASDGRATEASAPVWYRATVVSGDGSGTSSFSEATPSGSVAAAGERGDEIVIRLDCRWLEGAGVDAPARRLTYALSPG